MPFSEPEEISTVRINPAEVINHLLMIWVIDYIEESPTRFSRADRPSDVIVVDVVDLDQAGDDGGRGLLAKRVWWRPSQLIVSLRPKVGKTDRESPLLARMSLGMASPGFKPPFVLVSQTADQACVSLALDWLARHPDYNPYSKPSPALDPWEAHPRLPLSASAPPTPVRQETYLERLARQAQQGAANLPAPLPPQSEQPPY